ncbi:hypothetical protein HYU91_01525 [Candidatus Collierbacteria bacterium]|nr:hypothetical protein [Candidatus Collierbacteria bacterium]
MKLYLDSTNNRQVLIRLDDEEFITRYATPQEQDILSFLTESLKQKGRSLDDLTEIEVNPGPGSFTGSRVGVAIANALAFALEININGKSPPVLPVYDAFPHITLPKKGIDK